MKRLKNTFEIGNHINDNGAYTFTQFQDFVGVSYTDPQGVAHCNLIEIHNEYSDNPAIATSPAFAVDFNVIAGALDAWTQCRLSQS